MARGRKIGCRAGAGSDALDMLKEAKKLHDHWAAFRAIAERAGIRVAKYPY